MKTKTPLLQWMLFVGNLTVLGGADAAEVKVGVAAVDITPPLGIPMAGYYHVRGADGVLDPLFSKALVLEAEGGRVALVTLDLISVTRDITDRARTLIGKTAGIPSDRIMISATHAHTGPQLAGRGAANRDLGGQQELAVTYSEALPAKIRESIGYIPDRRSFAEGNYEPESARCTPGSGERLVEAAVTLLQSLHD